MLPLNDDRVFKGIIPGVMALCLTACGAGGGKPVDGAGTPEGAASGGAGLASVKVDNPSGYDRPDQAIYLNMAELGLAEDIVATKLAFYRDGQPIKHQLVDTNADGRRDSALVIMDLAAGASAQLTLRQSTGEPSVAGGPRTHAEIGVKAGGRWLDNKYQGGVFQDVESVTLPPQYTDHSEFLRYEGPGIESELIGYRVYLDWRNGFDIFGKQQYGLQLAQIGQDGYQSYHEPADWGMDILKVGDSVGIGGFGYWEDGALKRVSRVKQHAARVVEDGDLYSAFAVDYHGWEVAGKRRDLTARLSMQAGSRLVNVQLETDTELEHLAVGLVKHPSTTLLKGSLDITGEAWSYLATLGPQSMDGRQLTMFVLFKKESLVDFAEDEHNRALILKVRGGDLDYFFGAQWAGEPGADLSTAAVKAMLEREANRLTFQPRVHISNLASEELKGELGGAASALEWSKRAASSEILRHGTELAQGQFDSMRERPANWEYTMGMMTRAVYELGLATGEENFVQWAKGIVDSYVTEQGEILTYDKSKFNIDSINSGKMLLRLYLDTGEEKYRLAADKLRDQLRDHPRLDAGAFWHKQRYPYQLWLDGVYMGMPFLAQYSMLFENGGSLDEVLQEFRVTREFLRDGETGLYFHAWDEKKQQVWADPDTGLSRYFWARGMGWLAMALVDTLDFIPPQRAELRRELIDMSRDLADSLLKYQDEKGVWYQIVDLPGRTGNYAESSASTMFTYFLLKGVKNGILPDSYRGAALRAYDALIERFVLLDANGSLHVTQACQVGGLGFGRDGSYDYYMSEPVVNNDPKVLGPFIRLGPLVNSFQNP